MTDGDEESESRRSQYEYDILVPVWKSKKSNFILRQGGHFPTLTAIMYSFFPKLPHPLVVKRPNPDMPGLSSTMRVIKMDRAHSLCIGTI